ncbi:hypothetical protein KFK09_018844 [Dendrobium nobile]|uniref:Uncharacterized protein n=1 Tax=Dendrobium nobile TaxID=94219 RepID=A0A8T3AXA7_DENNO|nr:hypothetical protein KFK09_018844 [Dendrobium nobile]
MMIKNVQYAYGKCYAHMQAMIIRKLQSTNTYNAIYNETQPTINIDLQQNTLTPLASEGEEYAENASSCEVLQEERHAEK